MEDLVTKRYLDSTYLKENPEWDSGDAAWKAAKVHEFLSANDIHPPSICDIGCGSAACLFELRKYYPTAQLSGYDIAPDAATFWDYPEDAKLVLKNADALKVDNLQTDLILMLDVIEHVADPYSFISSYAGKSNLLLFHIPLDLSAQSVFREKPLLLVRKKVGHIHYYTKSLALALLEECGLHVINWQYTGAAFTAPQKTWKRMSMNMARRLAYVLVGKDRAVRLLGGETLLVLARKKTMRD